MTPGDLLAWTLAVALSVTVVVVLVVGIVAALRVLRERKP